MPRTKKEYRFLNIKMDKEIYERLEEFCEETGVSKTVAVERMLQRYFETYFEKSKKERALF